ncbi:MAG: nucleotide exchange factor GrpE [Flavobacteriaceae bacterium]|nr:nucleotide exchange factor GrpE [Flavobacteriaceae bacterium]
MEENKDLQEEHAVSNNEEITSEAVSDKENTENLTEEISLEEELAQQKDQYLRLFAEFENYKKRTLKEKMEFTQFANQNMMVAMLSILDDFERALKELAKTGESQHLKGVELIYNKFKNALVEKGLKSIEVNAGDDFNVDFHEAITQIPAPTEDLKGKIVDVIETGYKLHDKVIRFAKVVIGN